MTSLAPLTIIGIALLGNLITGAVSFALGVARGRQMGPTRTVETYTPRDAEDIPGWEDAPR